MALYFPHRFSILSYCPSKEEKALGGFLNITVNREMLQIA